MIQGEWALVEMLGHRQVMGQLSEVTVAGAGMLRIEIPSEPPGIMYVAPASLYAISPISEERARARYAKPAELAIAADYEIDDDDDEYDSEEAEYRARRDKWS